jgi:hypothetical protein
MCHCVSAQALTREEKEEEKEEEEEEHQIGPSARL